MEYKVTINGTEYGMDSIRSAEILRPMFDDFGIGNTCEARLKITLKPTGEIPRAARVVVSAGNGNSFQQVGVFYIDERKLTSAGLLSLVCYDSMMKADAIWEPSEDLTFPMTMKDAVDEITGLMGIGIDARSVVSDIYTIDMPAELTLRSVLGYIAAAHGANWIVTRNDELLLVPMTSDMVPDYTENSLLVTEDGAVITFGGVAIIV